MEAYRQLTLQNLRSGGAEQIVFDGSRPLFRLGQYPRVSEFLQALPMIKADPVGGAGPTANGGAFTMKLTVQRALTVPSASWYDAGGLLSHHLRRNRTDRGARSLGHSSRAGEDYGRSMHSPQVRVLEHRSATFSDVRAPDGTACETGVCAGGLCMK